MIYDNVKSKIVLDYIPTSFIIGNQKFNVVLYDELYLEDDPVYGLFDYLNSEISIRIKKLDDTLCDKEQVFNSFWHEVFHAFNYLYNNEMNESLAQTFANFMREFQSTVKY